MLLTVKTVIIPPIQSACMRTRDIFNIEGRILQENVIPFFLEKNDAIKVNSKNASNAQKRFCYHELQILTKHQTTDYFCQ